MGEEVDFFGRSPVARPWLIALIKSMVRPPDDAAQLAKNIDEFAWQTLDYRMIGYEKKRREARKITHAMLHKIKLLAIAILRVDDIHSDLSLLDQAIMDSLSDSVRQNNQNIANAISQSLSILASAPLAPDMRAFNKKPTNDEAIGEIILGIAAYCRFKGISFTGDPRRTLVDGKIDHIVKTPAAVLTNDVLEALGYPISPAQLGTYMRRGIQASAAI